MNFSDINLINDKIDNIFYVLLCGDQPHSY